MAEVQSLKEKTAKGLFWGGLSSGLQQLLGLLFGIVLARLLDRADYGMIGMLAIFPSIASVLQNSGFIEAVANLKTVSGKVYNSVFWFSVICSVVLYVILFFAAPLIAAFYRIEELTCLARVSFLGFLISGFGIAPRAILFRNLKVKENAVISLVSLVVSGLTGIVLALYGMAYWGLAIQSIVYVAVVVILNFYYAGWCPSWHVDFSPIRQMFGFSSKLLVTNIFNTVNNNLFAIILGRFYSRQQVGDYTQASGWNNKGYALITGMLSGITQPVLARVTDDKDRQLAVLRKMLRFTALVTFPAMFGLSLISREVIVIMLTDKWIESACILQILCVWGAFVPINDLLAKLLVSRGHSSVFMYNTIALSLLQLIIACFSYPYGIKVMVCLFVCVNIGWMVIWRYFVGKEINLSFLAMLKDIAPYMLLSAALAVATHLVTLGISNIYLSLIVKVALMALPYVIVLWLTRSVIFRECVEFIIHKRLL